MAENMISRPRIVAVLSTMVLLCLTGNNNFVPVAEAIWLTIPSSGTKCVSEEIQNNVVVLADYHVIDDANPQHPSAISARVTSPYGSNLHHNENVTVGRFAFTTSEAGNYMACFWLNSNQQQSAGTTLSLDWRIGITAKDWESVAKKEKIEGVEFDLKRLGYVVQAIHENLVYLKSREADMREVSELTNSRVAWFSIMSIGICIVVSALQLWHLTLYFQKKKLI
ncbi:hypothetical protein LWI28_014154 [Acer negundo]|uniref:GOLD domain-containing protein n=1 Tax=Acer negundo TaxID=4023 RepID=A0AAD5JHV5_ACENE|nr:hypothetical protein LWI28_014154 [Acer negundo]KAK4860281.1 hypothetical protein QYF36_020590 [Acer negundo]